ncbi:MAG TPA: ion transporter [Gammaproteobacteria bacterium]|jgi:voltage-gated sodium channel|nr:ion transporter [Gammaproteobacteria bacterium]|tara:strand:- start:194 stop:997 length:804 start_codon:yes stop_codon:yes gene_type:complete
MAALSMRELQIFFDRIRSNKVFELFVVAVILFSAVMIGVNSYALDDRLMQILLILDVAITVFFLFELSIRFLGEPEKRAFFRQGWNVFDTLIVTVSLIPIDESELALLGRLIRIFRVLRMVSIVPELRVLVNSLLRALPQLGYVCLLMFIIFYIYAAIGTSIFASVNPVLWGDIAVSLLTLFRVMTFEDWTDVMYETINAGFGWSWIYYLSFIFLTAFAFLNMIIGIVVKVLEDEHQRERDAHKGAQPNLSDIQLQLAELKALVEKR